MRQICWFTHDQIWLHLHGIVVHSFMITFGLFAYVQLFFLSALSTRDDACRRPRLRTGQHSLGLLVEASWARYGALGHGCTDRACHVCPVVLWSGPTACYSHLRCWSRPARRATAHLDMGLRTGPAMFVLWFYGQGQPLACWFCGFTVRANHFLMDLRTGLAMSRMWT